MLQLLSTSAEDTRRIGELLAHAVMRPAVLLLRGDYGTGKTTFVQGVARGLGITGAVRSPSYNIVKLYDGSGGSLVHADLYRTPHQVDIDELGLWEFVGPDSIVAVEWPGELTPPGLDYNRYAIEFVVQAGPAANNCDGNGRSIALTSECGDGNLLEGALGAFVAGQ